MMKTPVMMAALVTATTGAGCSAPCAAPGAQEQWLLGTIDDGTVIEVAAFEVLRDGINAGSEFGGDAPGTLETEGALRGARFMMIVKQGDHTVELELRDVGARGTWTIGDDDEADVRVTVDGLDATDGTFTTGSNDSGHQTFTIDGTIDGAPLTGSLELFAFGNDSGCV